MKSIKRLWNWGVNKFLNKQFLTFGIIGVINTLVHVGTLALVYLFLRENNSFHVMVANSIAFCVASIFSYFANNKFTFKNDNVSVSKMIQTILVFLGRLIMTNLITLAFVELFKYMKLGSIWTGYVGPIIAMIIMIPLCYLVLEKILKVNKNEGIEE